MKHDTLLDAYQEKISAKMGKAKAKLEEFEAAAKEKKAQAKIDTITGVRSEKKKGRARIHDLVGVTKFAKIKDEIEKTVDALDKVRQSAVGSRNKSRNTASK